mmetsp:Transcript_20654/g.45290  ORF Transcript_20654/g.45290 Transcript_20654/m.45290 type:complete len:438 (-) Transcript_20654:45-1358(-)
MVGQRVFVVGLGMSNFVKPKAKGSSGPGYEDFVEVAVGRALYDAQLTAKDVDHAALGRYVDTAGSGQQALHRLGFHGIPIFNVANACATGSNALYVCRQLIRSGEAQCTLAVGVEEMAPGSLSLPSNRSLNDHVAALESQGQMDLSGKLPAIPQMFAAAAREHMRRYGTTARHFALVGEKNHRHSQNNPYSQFRDVYSVEQVEQSTMVAFPITKLQCSPTSDGAAAALLCSEAFVRSHGLEGQAIEILAQRMTTHSGPALRGDADPRDVVGFEMARRCAEQVYDDAGIVPEKIDVVELHDCFSANELLTYEALQLCPEGGGGALLESGALSYGGSGPIVNPSGGLISKGHPIGATGVAQCCELCWQLRGECGPRQVPRRGQKGPEGPELAMQHNLGLPGQVVCTVYGRPAEWRTVVPKRPVSGALGYSSPGSPMSKL